jgi:hypothetical protein
MHSKYFKFKYFGNKQQRPQKCRKFILLCNSKPSILSSSQKTEKLKFTKTTILLFALYGCKTVIQRGKEGACEQSAEEIMWTS